MLINIITPYGNNRFELSVDGTTELIRKAYEIAENEADTNEDANIKEHICECGHKLKIQNLKPMYVHCDCGKDFRYYTNIEDENFKYECINCGEEVDIQINTRGTAYVTKRKDNHSGGGFLIMADILV